MVRWNIQLFAWIFAAYLIKTNIILCILLDLCVLVAGKKASSAWIWFFYVDGWRKWNGQLIVYDPCVGSSTAPFFEKLEVNNCDTCGFLHKFLGDKCAYRCHKRVLSINCFFCCKLCRNSCFCCLHMHKFMTI